MRGQTLLLNVLKNRSADALSRYSYHIFSLFSTAVLPMVHPSYGILQTALFTKLSHSSKEHSCNIFLYDSFLDGSRVEAF